MDARVLLFVAIILGTGAQAVLKLGANQLGEFGGFQDMFQQILRIVTNPIIILGMAMQVVAAFFWIGALSRLDLSYAYPMLAVGYVVVVLAGWVLFGEHITFLRILAIALVVIGGSLLNVNAVD